MRLRPDSEVTSDDLARGKRTLVKDAAWASLVGALYGGVILVGFALELGATPFIIGLLAAIPFFAQLAQLPTIALVERLRQRRKIAVFAVSVSRAMILALAAIPFIGDPPLRLAALILAQLLITMCGSIGGLAVNSWMHQLLANEPLGISSPGGFSGPPCWPRSAPRWRASWCTTGRSPNPYTRIPPRSCWPRRPAS